MKKTVSISIDGDFLEALKNEAWKRKLSLSLYIEKSLRANPTSNVSVEDFGAKQVEPIKTIESTAADRIREKISIESAGYESDREDEIIKKAQAELEKKRELNGTVKTSKGPVKANPALTDFMGGYSKNKQLGRRTK